MWKAEKELKKKAEKKNQRPTFKTSILPRHKYYSPPNRVTSKKITMKNNKNAQVKLSAVSNASQVDKKLTTKDIKSKTSSSSESSSSSSSESSSSDSSSSSSSSSESSTSSSSSSESLTQVDETVPTETATTSSTKSTSEESYQVASPSTSSSESESSPASIKSKSDLASNKTSSLSPIDVARLHEIVALQERRTLHEICTLWTKKQSDIDLPADEIRLVNTEIARHSHLINKEITRFSHTIAGFDPLPLTFICSKEYKRF